MGKPFVINRHGRLVFPSNFLADFDFSAIETEEQLSAVVLRDFEAKAPTGVEIMAKATSGGYRSRFQLLRDLAGWATGVRTAYETLEDINGN